MYRIPILLLLLIASPAFAQVDNSPSYGSVYSRFGLGERQSTGSSQSDAMGYVGTALRSSIYNGLNNPAHAADMAVTTLGVQVDVRAVEAQNAAGARSRHGTGGLGGLQVGIPLSPDRLGLSLSFRPYSRVNYRAVEEGDFIGVDGENQSFVVNYEGAGGLQELQAGLGLRIGSAFQIGARADFIFGVIDYRERTEFLEGGATYQTVRTTTATNLSGVTGTLGALYSAELGNDRMLTFGTSLTLPARLTGRRTFTLGTSLAPDSLGAPVAGTATLPFQARFGVAYIPSPRLTLASDVEFEPWSNFESDFVFGGFAPSNSPGGGVNELRDRVRAGAGLQFLPAGSDRQAPFTSQVAYRLGAYFEQGLASPGGSSINTQAVTLGFSLPTAVQGPRIDLGFEGGLRGSTGMTPDGRSLVRDLFFKGTVSLNFGERWFIRRLLG